MNEATLDYYDEAGKRKAVPAGLDLHVIDAARRSRRYPVAFTPFYLGTPASGLQPDVEVEVPATCLVLEPTDGRLFVTNHSQAVPLKVNRSETDQAELFDGDSFKSAAPGCASKASRARLRPSSPTPAPASAGSSRRARTASAAQASAPTRSSWTMERSPAATPRSPSRPTAPFWRPTRARP